MTGKTGTDFGKHGYAPGVGEDIEPKRTWSERFINWLVEAPYAAEEREALLQIARRTKLRTDLQEARVRERIMAADKRWAHYQERCKEWGDDPEKYKTVGVWSHPYRRGDISYKVRIYCEENAAHRRIRLDHVVKTTNGGKSIQMVNDQNDEMRGLLEFIKTSEAYLTVVNQWVRSRITSAEMAKRLKKRDVEFVLYDG